MDWESIISFATALVISFMMGCATSPEGRRQMLLVQDGEMNSMGAKAFSEMKTKTPIENDPEINAYVRCVADAIARESTAAMRVDSWEVVVFKDSSANAFSLPHSRTQESEADKIGEKLMAQAGFDPRDSVELWKNMAAASGGKNPPQWLSTHPSHDTRIAGLQSGMEEALGIYQKARASGRVPNCAL